jgi:hypothetical protein
MSSFGRYVQKDFTDGSAAVPLSAANMDEISRVCEIADEELGRSQYFRFRDYKQYYYDRNTKTIEYFQDHTDWTGLSGGETLSTDTTNKFIGEAGVRCTEDDDTASFIGITRNISSINLTEFNDGGASGDDDLIAYSVYISDDTKLSSITVKLGDDNSNNYSYSVFASSLGNGYNTLYVRKSEFATNGTPSGWDDITWINCQSYTETNGSGGYFTALFLQLVREDPEHPYYSNPFQIYRGAITGWENIFSQISDLYQIYKDPTINRLGMGKVNEKNESGNEYDLHVFCSVVNFIGKFEMYCKDDGELTSITWQVDINNYIEVYCQLDVFYLSLWESGVHTTYSVALDNPLVYNERVNLYFEKNGDYIKAILKKDSEQIKVLEHETTISIESIGCVYFGHYSTTGHSFITDFSFSNTQNAQLSSWDRPKYVIKTVSTSKQNDTSVDADPELYVDLPPNSVFAFDVNLQVYSSSTTPDFQCRWTVSGDAEFLTKRHITSASNSTTDITNSNGKFQVYPYTTAVSAGLDGSRNAWIHEKFLVKTGNIGGRVTLSWSQDNSDAAYTTLVEGSYLKIDKCIR